MKLGLQSRVLILTLLVLGTSFSLAGWVLDASFRASILMGAEEQMRLVIYSVMGAVDESDGALEFTDDTAQQRLSLPDSGLYAMVQTGDSATDGAGLSVPLWVSRSARLTGVDFLAEDGGLAPGDFRFTDGRNFGMSRFFLSYAVIWEAGEEVELVFRAAADTGPFEAQIMEFRRNLWFGLAGVAGLLMLVQVVAVRVGLKPVRVMADEVAELEAGERSSLSGDYPRELHALAENLDRFVAHETASRARYRNALDDLAHSLKTPVAVIKNALAAPDALDRPLLSEQLGRMETTVAHQLSRVVTSGPVVVGHLVNVRAVADRLVRALQTAYRARDLDVTVAGPQELAFRGDERDLMEILGNLLENACKYTATTVRVSCSVAPAGAVQERIVVVQIDDDGPGIPEEKQQQLLTRGARGDTAVQGQGIGLSVVVELVSLYGGELTLGSSDLGGARVVVELPGQLRAGG